MSSQRRQVRATPLLFADLDRQLPSERGPNGEPSINDFQSLDLLEIVEEFATGFDDLPALIPGRDDYRILITTGRLVPAYSVTGSPQTAPSSSTAGNSTRPTVPWPSSHVRRSSETSTSFPRTPL